MAANPEDPTMKVKPAEGRAVRDPRTMNLLPDEGAEVSDRDVFWRRRLRDGDVVLVEDQPATREA
jgi:hypothetical protein